VFLLKKLEGFASGPFDSWTVVILMLLVIAVVFSDFLFCSEWACLYLQLLYQHADNLSREMVPSIFRHKKSKKYNEKLQSFLWLSDHALSSFVQVSSYFWSQDWGKKRGS
jgi:hypothetical protein